MGGGSGLKNGEGDRKVRGSDGVDRWIKKG